MGIVENTYAELKQQELKNNPYSCLHMADIANYAQTECQFRYCGTAIPFLTVRSTAR